MMTDSRTDHGVLRDPNYLALEKHYVDHPIALYTGAGVSWARNARYGLCVWNDFVRRILIEHEGLDSPALAEPDRRVQRDWADEPWQMADWVEERCGPAFQGRIVAIVQREENLQRWMPLVLGHLYGRGLTHDRGEDEIEILIACRNRIVRRTSRDRQEV